MSAARILPIRDFCETGSGTTPPRDRASEYYSGTIPWVKSGELRETLINQTEECVTEKALAETPLKRVPAGAVLIAMYGATVGRVGQLGIEATTNQAVCHVLPDPRKADARYIFHALQEKSRELIARGVGGAQPNINQGIIKDTRIYLPTLDEQRRIATILDDADSLLRARQRAIELLNTFSLSLFNETFLLHETLDWPLVNVEDLAIDIRTGPFGSQLLHSEFVEDGIAVLGIDNAVNNEFAWDQRRFITPEKYQALKRFTVRPSDVLITIMGTCGRCAVVPDDIPLAINTKHLCCLTLDQTKALPAFLHAALLNHPNILKQLGVQAKGAVMPGLNMGIIKKLSLRLPPVNLQRTFAAKLAAANRLQLTIRQSSEKLVSLLGSLRQRAFRGEL